jgi:hypothetical protein
MIYENFSGFTNVTQFTADQYENNVISNKIKRLIIQ